MPALGVEASCHNLGSEKCWNVRLQVVEYLLIQFMRSVRFRNVQKSPSIKMFMFIFEALKVSDEQRPMHVKVTVAGDCGV